MNFIQPADAQRQRPFQFGLRRLLAATAMLAVAAGMLGRAGTVEILIVTATAAVVLLMVLCLGNRGRWLPGLVLIAALAAAATPPDPASMLLCAVPAGIAYVLGALVWQAMRGRPAG